MKKWEYALFGIHKTESRDWAELQRKFNYLGEQGWELVSTSTVSSGTNLFFKRPLVTQKESNAD